MKTNIILTDSGKSEVTDFADGLRQATGEPFLVEERICNEGRSKLYNIKRYLTYALFPLRIVIHKSRYHYVIGWQQFFALFFAGYCKWFHLKKDNIVIACNFTYKKKAGLTGLLYKKLMVSMVDNPYLDGIHVPSASYARKCADYFGVPVNRFVITPFGLPDTYDEWKDSSVSENNYSLAIGRSNRDYDFLMEVWRQLPEEENLIVISDTWKPKAVLPPNVIHKNNISGDAQFPYIANCKVMIIPIKDGEICSGDTVLLKAMSYKKPVMVSIPSTLGEMYIDDGINGLLCEKDVFSFANKLSGLLSSEAEQNRLSGNARRKYLEQYSRLSMGVSIGEKTGKR